MIEGKQYVEFHQFTEKNEIAAARKKYICEIYSIFVTKYIQSTVQTLNHFLNLYLLKEF